jgi:hypothetical protein
MPRIQIDAFCGPSYTAHSPGVSADRTVNLYPIVLRPEVRPPELALIGTPGLSRLCDLPGAPVRMLHTCTNGRVFAAAGAHLYELFAAGTWVTRGPLSAGTGRVSMDDNGIAAMVVDGPAGWVLTFASNAYARITDSDFPGADFVAFLDGYFVFNIPGTGRFGLTGLYDPAAVDGLDIATAEARADPLLRVLVFNRELRLFGTLTTESWFNSGNADFPFQPIQGTLLEQGLLAPDTLNVLGTSLLWLQQNSQGQGKVLRMSGYSGEVVSTPPLEAAWASYPRLDDATAWSYTAGGHDFYVLTFPSGWPVAGVAVAPTGDPGRATGVTWVLDLTTGFWHERAALFPDGQLGRHRAQVHCLGFGHHLVGDYATGTVYRLDERARSDAGRALVRLRRFPHLRAQRTRLYHGSLEIHLEQGLEVDATVHPRHLMLRWSNDGGQTYSAEHWRELGPVGAYRQRARWHKLGQARDRVYEVRSTADAPSRWLAAYLDGEGAA